MFKDFNGRHIKGKLDASVEILEGRLSLAKAERYMRLLIGAATNLPKEVVTEKYSAKSGRIHG